MAETMVQGANAGARLDRLPLARFHRRITMLIGLGMFLDACDIYLAGGVLGALVKSGWSTLPANARFLSFTFFGMLIGTFGAGLIGDRFGRRFSYQVNLLIFGLASIAAAFAPSMGVLIGLRFIMGIGLGAEIVVGYSSLAEFIPRAARGRYVARLAIITNAAVPVVGFAGAWIIPTIGWRYLFAIIGVCALIIWVLRKNMPESPRWLEARGRAAEADALLRSIEAEVSQGAPLPPVAEAPAQPRASSLKELVMPGLLGSTIVGMIISVAGGISLYGFLAWVPTFLVKQGFSVVHSLSFSAAMGLGAPLGAYLGSLIVDRLPRVKTIVALSFATAMLSAIYPLSGSAGELVVVGFCLTLCAYALVAIAYGLYIPELFPTRLRLRGVALAAGTGRLAVAFVQVPIVFIYQHFGVAGVAAFLACMMAAQGLAVFFLGRETQRRSLEEIASAIGAAEGMAAAPAPMPLADR